MEDQGDPYKSLTYEVLEGVYSAQGETYAPNVMFTTVNGYVYMRSFFTTQQQLEWVKTETDDYDDFTEWVKDVRKKAKEPRNKELRSFIEKRYPRPR
jgi:hypothetical protein